MKASEHLKWHVYMSLLPKGLNMPLMIKEIANNFTKRHYNSLVIFIKEPGMNNNAHVVFTECGLLTFFILK